MENAERKHVKTMKKEDKQICIFYKMLRSALR